MKAFITTIIILALFAGIGAYKVFTDLHTNRITDTAVNTQTRSTETFNGFLEPK